MRRLAEQIQMEISDLLLRGLKDPRIGFVTITDVELSPDLSRAWVYFSTPEGPEKQEQLLEGLRSASGFIRKVLGKRLHIKQIPEFEFKYDHSLDRGDRIERILADVREKEGWDDPGRTRGSAEEVARALREGKRFLVTSHRNPDGDAVAAVLGLGNILRRMDREVVLYNPDPVPHNFRFLPRSDEILTEYGTGPFDTIVVMDCSELDRAGPLPELAGSRLVGIDHHLTTSPLGDVYYLDPRASSIGEMLHRMLPHLPLEMDIELATCIYTSILSDTGSFRYSNTTPEALHVAAEAVGLGVSPWDVSLQVYESQPVERVRLLARVLDTLEIDASGRYGSILVTQEMFEQTGTSLELIDGFINVPRGIRGIEVAIQFRQDGAERYKVSFRSRGIVNVAEIAEQFGGGGHANASGCSLDGSLEEVQERIYGAVEKALRACDSSQER
ncbi:MAG: 30S ribosome-binding factor RbfA [Deltaproteobacteria bacterium]|nr:30S ribosome-binding factor RbfA [Deltaproteobacteria bacterium]